MTAYAIQLASGGYIAIREGGIVRHVDKPEEARQFEFATWALLAAEWLELGAGYKVIPVEAQR